MDTLRLTDKANSGVPGLDDVLGGGFTRGCLFLIEGNPGTGKTTMALRFLLQGAVAGERNLYITLSETKSELLNGAASHGWSLSNFNRRRACSTPIGNKAYFIPPNWSWARP
jgi:circadian clock protein KaiC